MPTQPPDVKASSINSDNALIIINILIVIITIAIFVFIISKTFLKMLIFMITVSGQSDSR